MFSLGNMKLSSVTMNHVAHVNFCWCFLQRRLNLNRQYHLQFGLLVSLRKLELVTKFRFLAINIPRADILNQMWKLFKIMLTDNRWAQISYADNETRFPKKTPKARQITVFPFKDFNPEPPHHEGGVITICLWINMIQHLFTCLGVRC